MLGDLPVENSFSHLLVSNLLTFAFTVNSAQNALPPPGSLPRLLSLSHQLKISCELFLKLLIIGSCFSKLCCPPGQAPDVST